MKKILLVVSFLGLLFIFGCGVRNSSNETGGFNIENKEGVVQVYYFWGNGCPHCAKQNDYFDNLLTKEKYKKNINLNKFEVWNNQKNSKLLSYIGNQMGFRITGVPTMFVGGEKFTGLTKDKLKNKIDNCIENGCKDPLIDIINNY